MDDLEAIQRALPGAAEDVVANLKSCLLESSTLSERQRWGVALASAYVARSPALRTAITHEVEQRAPDVIEDAKTAAILMAQNNVYFRFRHLVEKAEYLETHSRLRMSRRNKVESRVDFELFALAVSALHGCGSCVKHHEEQAVKLGLRKEQVNDAVRIASVLYAAAIALELG